MEAALDFHHRMEQDRLTVLIEGRSGLPWPKAMRSKKPLQTVTSCGNVVNFEVQSHHKPLEESTLILRGRSLSGVESGSSKRSSMSLVPATFDALMATFDRLDATLNLQMSHIKRRAVNQTQKTELSGPSQRRFLRRSERYGHMLEDIGRKIDANKSLSTFATVDNCLNQGVLAGQKSKSHTNRLPTSP
jgi:hypothetical protein